MTVSLGMPALPPPVVAPRRLSRKIRVGKVEVGGDAPISVQSMCTTLTSDVNTTLQQIAELTAAVVDGAPRRLQLAAPNGRILDANAEHAAALVYNSIGIVTPSGLFFERSHAGTTTIDPRRHTL